MGFVKKYRSFILYGLAMAVLLFLLKWLQLRLMIVDNALELYTGAIAVIFTGLGIWLAVKLTKRKPPMIINGATGNGPFVQNNEVIKSLNLSRRELEVLALMANGLSNDEIAQSLFVSVSTVKTHSRNLFEKLDVERRTQAVDRARKLGIIR